MFYIVAIVGMTLSCLATLTLIAVCILIGIGIDELSMSTRTLMYIGACCGMVLGFLGSSTLLGSIVHIPQHYLWAAVLFSGGLAATAHIALDLNERLNI
jgi:predicted tellurium resistance membrane protein TerC